jgi:hypothetical protein
LGQIKGLGKIADVLSPTPCCLIANHLLSEGLVGAEFLKMVSEGAHPKTMQSSSGKHSASKLLTWQGH